MVPHAMVHVENAAVVRDTKTDSLGHFSLLLPPGTYQLTVNFAGFRPTEETVDLPAGEEGVSLRLKLVIAPRAEEVAVPSDQGAETAADENQNALILRAADLDTFSGEDATFENELLALAGAYGSVPQIYVNGFSGGRFPPKNTIRTVRINRNPYSAQYDALGVGRIEISTKPGTQALHGTLQSSGTTAGLNTPNPLVTGVQPSYYILNTNGNLSGPLGKKTSFFTAGTYNDQQDNAAVNAQTEAPAAVSEAVPNPQTVQTYSARVDRQMSAQNTFTGRYEFNRLGLTNGGVGLLVLPTEGYSSTTNTQTLQLSDEQILGKRTVNQTRFQYIRTRLDQEPNALGTSPLCSAQTAAKFTASTVIVEGSCSGGGSPGGVVHDNQDRFEFQDYVSVEYKTHFIRAGVRYRLVRDSNLSTANYNGQFLFQNLSSYNAATPEFFTLTTGTPSAAVVTGDAGVYIEDEWRARKNVTVDYGFRFESQSGIPDHFDPAPRVGGSWAITRKGKTLPLVVLRGGAGMFYDRFAPTDLLTAARENGVLQQNYTVQGADAVAAYTNPKWTPPTATTIWRLSSRLRSAYDLFGGFSAEHTFGRYGTASVNYLAARGVHQYLSRNINAPLPGTYDPSNPNSGTRPLGGTNNLYEFSSDGMEKAQLVYFNARFSVTHKLTVFGSYVISHQNADAGGSTAFPSNQYNLAQDYGPKTGSSRQSLYTGGSLQLPHGFTASTFFSPQSGKPFNVTIATDENGDAQFNDRPYEVDSSLANGGTIKTLPGCGTFAQPGSQPAGAKLAPFNACTGPGFLYLQLSLSKGFSFGHMPAPAAVVADEAASKTPPPAPVRPFHLDFSAEADNVLNRTNYGLPVGVLDSSLFGKSLALASNFGSENAANRVINLQTTFTF
jgi:hypothetical protein